MRYGDWASLCSEYNEPCTVTEALSGPDADEWKKAMDREINSFKENDVWKLSEPSANHEPIKSKWVFKKKVGPDGTVVTYKARLVVKGYSQKFGQDYDETFSPVVRFESVRAILALAAQRNLKLHQMDVTTAFLNGKLKEDIYMNQPEQYINVDKPNLVYKLNKSVYGLKQAPRCWNSYLDSYLKENKFEQSKSDSCIYTRVIDDDLCILAVYVDDLIIASKLDRNIDFIKSMLSSKYAMKDLGRLSYFLGVNINQNDNGVFINQSTYIDSLLKRFSFDDCNPISTPCDFNSYLEKATENDDLFDRGKYQSAVGALLYLSTRTRPDITYAVCNVAKFSSNPSNKHWSAVKRIFRYLKGTSLLGIKYVQNNDISCVGFADADWAGDRADRKSTSGYCFTMSGGAISWRTSKQQTVAYQLQRQNIFHYLVHVKKPSGLSNFYVI